MPNHIRKGLANLLVGGAQDIDALIAYFADFKSPNPPYDPNAAALSKPRIIRADAGTTCP